MLSGGSGAKRSPHAYRRCMKRLQNIDRVWAYIQREVEEEFGPHTSLTTDECVIAVCVVSALTKMLAEDDSGVGQ